MTFIVISKTEVVKIDDVHILPNTYLKRTNFICIYFTNVVYIYIQ